MRWMKLLRKNPPSNLEINNASFPRSRVADRDQLSGQRTTRRLAQQHDTAYSQLTAVKEKLFPGGDLQERVDNVLSILINNPGFIAQLLEGFEPLALEFAVVEEA